MQSLGYKNIRESFHCDTLWNIIYPLQSKLLFVYPKTSQETLDTRMLDLSKIIIWLQKVNPKNTGLQVHNIKINGQWSLIPSPQKYLLFRIELTIHWWKAHIEISHLQVWYSTWTILQVILYNLCICPIFQRIC